ncbi:MAG: hypothetical protein NZR01_08135 [Bryobacteraceae bacterium]|nr:hypothetical protein [Bryobacteraceae bacterium]
MLTHWACLLLALPLLAAQPPQEPDYQVYTDAPRLLLNERRLRLLKRERERESIRWQQFDALMRGRARMSEPGFALALWGTVAAQPGACRDAAEWAAKADPADPGELRQIALVYDWCQQAAGEALAQRVARKLKPALELRKGDARHMRSLAFAALALADAEPRASEAALRFVVESWWQKTVVPQLRRGASVFATREELYAMVELLHALRDNLRIDLREGLGQWFEELPPLLILSYYPQPWPAPENEYRIPAYWTPGEPDLREAAYSRAAELALVAYDTNAKAHQFLQGWLMIDRFLMRGEFGIAYEFFWANPYQPGLSFTYMPDLFHGRGQLLVRSGWEEDAAWFGYWDGRAQLFLDGRRILVRPEAQPRPIEMGPARILFAPGGLRFETGWLTPGEEGEKTVEEVAFVLGMEPGARYDVEVDGEEMFEAEADQGGILELRFRPGRKAAVRIRKSK